MQELRVLGRVLAVAVVVALAWAMIGGWIEGLAGLLGDAGIGRWCHRIERP